jgi:hypothetical protein
VSDYPPDPGGVFASDYHRRVAAHLPVPAEDPVSVDDLVARLDGDVFTGLGSPSRLMVTSILDDLSETGDVKFLTGAEGWRLLKAGLEKLTGPALTTIEVIDGEPTMVEPPPLDGPKLEEAEAQQQRIADEGDATEKAALTAAVERAKEQLAAAEDAASKAGVS